MKRALLVFALMFGASSAWAAGTTSARQKSAQPMTMNAPVTVTMDQLKWGPAPPGLPKGSELSVLTGNPEKAGPFDLMVKMPTGYKVPMHWHSNAESLTIVGGTVAMTHGDQKHELAVGGFTYLPAKMTHAAECTSSDACIIQIHGTGPFDIHYVNPADDPRTQRQARPPPRTR